MKYKYQFKNKDLGKAVEVIFGENNVEKILNGQIKDETKIILLTIDRPDGIRSNISIPKEEIERVRAYDPEGWNPFPTFRPTRSGSYLVYLNGRFENRINAAYYNTDYRNWDTYSDASVLAFRELEIEPPDEDVLKISRAARE